ncbi:hypothetical protein [Janibacter sp. YB324]|uniref:hypothetical protein n=1 Tax=Janibacter sp. YB324 TaxID=2761047 RepID=UPI0016231952|nr:hypothetical protein [Janibacter sp. YB324]QNF93458.1 hypothetical protein H7A72_11840 [Janibacter sp. YB324]
MGQSNTSVRRRQVVKGAAWTAPVIVMGTAAPAQAASPPPPGLQGWVTVGKNCGTDRLTIDGTGGNGAEPPNTGTRGLWIYNTTASTQIANPRITLYYPSSLGTITWTAVSGNSNWSVPVPSTVDPPIAGYIAYTTFYTGGWQFRSAYGYSRASGRPNFQASVNISCSGTIPIYARRTVTVSGETISFIRGPVSL